MTKSRSKRTTPLTREAIIDSAREMLDTTSLDGLSLRRLATSLGVTAPALYAHVEDKRDLLAALAAQGYQELLESFEKVDADDPIDRILAYARAYVDKAVHDPEVFKVMFIFRPGVVPLPGVDNELSAATDAFLRPSEAVLAAMESGRIHPDRDAVLTSMTLWTAAHGLASVLLLGQQGGFASLYPNAQELIDDVLTVTVAGLATPPAPVTG
jgi:AcrR family transcriptional regulator